MRRILIAGLIAAGMMCSAGAQDLPADVAQAYRDYQTAMSAGDAPGLLEAASRAYAAAESADIDRATLAVLAENVGFAAGVNGEYAQSQQMWRESARLSDRARLPAADRAWRWHNASLNALRAQDVDDAYACSRQAVRALDDVEDVANVADFAADSYLTHAGMALRRGQIVETGRSAREAVDRMEAAGPQLELRYGLALFYLGIADTLSQDFLDATYALTIAHNILSEVAPDHPDLHALHAARTSALLELQRGEGESAGEQNDQLQSMLAGNPVFAERFLDRVRPDPAEVERPEGWVDAELISRISPRYPPEAANAGIAGVVYLRFDLTAEGRPDNVEIVGSFPYNTFDQVVHEAIAGWQYTPASIDGTPVRREGVTVRFSFHTVEGNVELRHVRRQYAREERRRRRGQ